MIRDPPYGKCSTITLAICSYLAEGQPISGSNCVYVVEMADCRIEQRIAMGNYKDIDTLIRVPWLMMMMIMITIAYTVIL